MLLSTRNAHLPRRLQAFRFPASQLRWIQERSKDRSSAKCGIRRRFHDPKKSQCDESRAREASRFPPKLFVENHTVATKELAFRIQDLSLAFFATFVSSSATEEVKQMFLCSPFQAIIRQARAKLRYGEEKSCMATWTAKFCA